MVHVLDQFKADRGKAGHVPPVGPSQSVAEYADKPALHLRQLSLFETTVVPSSASAATLCKVRDAIERIFRLCLVAQC